jgi:hypothetical protein
MSKTTTMEVTKELDKLFFNSKNLPPKVKFKSNKPSKVQESPLDARSPQEILERHGMYKDESIYTKHPERVFLDLSEFGDFEANLNANRRMQEKFNALDIDVRARFNHDVKEFTKYVTSNNFDINNVLTSKEQEAYKKYKENEKLKADYEKYMQSDEYKAFLEERAHREAYEKSRYDEWKSNYMQHKK